MNRRPISSIPRGREKLSLTLRVGIAVGMFLVPLPGRFDDLVQIGKPGLPVQFATNLLAAGD